MTRRDPLVGSMACGWRVCRIGECVKAKGRSGKTPALPSLVCFSLRIFLRSEEWILPEVPHVGAPFWTLFQGALEGNQKAVTHRFVLPRTPLLAQVGNEVANSVIPTGASCGAPKWDSQTPDKAWRTKIAKSFGNFPPINTVSSCLNRGLFRLFVLLSKSEAIYSKNSTHTLPSWKLTGGSSKSTDVWGRPLSTSSRFPNRSQAFARQLGEVVASVEKPVLCIERRALQLVGFALCSIPLSQFFFFKERSDGGGGSGIVWCEHTRNKGRLEQ